METLALPSVDSAIRKTLETQTQLSQILIACALERYRDATGSKEKGFELHHLVKTKVPKLVVSQSGPITQTQATRLLRSIESYVDGVEREDWIPSPGLQCGSCEFFEECSLWKGGV